MAALNPSGEAAGAGSRAPSILCFCLGLAGMPACQGNTEAGPPLLRLAQAYEHGEGVAKDPGRALRLYCQAARQGNGEAQFSLGWMYANGRGIPRDDGLAAYFFGLAARQGHAQARSMLRYVGEPSRRVPACMAPESEVAVPAAAREPAADTPARRRIRELVFRLAPEFGVQPDLVLAVIHTESNFNPAAVSPKNAQGLMQLIPETSARFNVRRPFDAEQNLRGGLAYLRWLLAYFRGDVALVAAAYNAGEGAVHRFRGIPPFPETRDYVRRILGLFRRDRHPYDQSVTDPWPELSRIRGKD